MDKQQFLGLVREMGGNHLVSKNELVDAYNAGQSGDDVALFRRIGLSDVLSYLGAAIVFLGIAVLIWQNWDSLNTPLRIIVTLGMSLAAYVEGVLLQRNKKSEVLSQASFIIAFLLMPLGLEVTFHEAGLDLESNFMQSVISALLVFAGLASVVLYKRSLFLAFTVLFGTWFFFAFTGMLVENNPVFSEDFFTYRILVTGLAYLLLGHSFSRSKHQGLTAYLYSIGTMLFLGAALYLGGWSPDQNMFWELLFPFLVFGTIFLGVLLKVRSFLLLGSIFLMIYILKITAEYFERSMGWPLALVVAGFLLIGIGYVTVYVNRKYLK